MGPVVWDVVGSGLSLREHVSRQAGVKRVTVHEARGRLIAGLDILARLSMRYIERGTFERYSKNRVGADFRLKRNVPKRFFPWCKVIFGLGK